MSIAVYSGLMGSGKSYEAVKTSLLPAIRKGRRVVTNISGVSQSAIHDFLVNEGLERAKLGLILIVSNERVLEPNFFPGEAAVSFKFEVPEWVPLPQLRFYADEYVLHQGKNFTKTIFQLMLPDLKRLRDGGFDIGSCLVTAATREWKTVSVDFFSGMPSGEIFAELPDSGPSVVEAGDLVIIDEAWRYWAEDTKLSAEHMNFFRMHRHYVDEKGVCCDLVVLIQDFGSLHRFLRRVCELVLIFYKLKALGLMSRYRVEVYEGRPRRASLTSTSPWQKYNKKIFPLYKSYDGVAGKEGVVDDRQNLFKNKWFMAVT